MKTSFDQQLKQQLDQSRPEDLGYKPDRDKLWGRIEAKQKRKTLPLRLWISHAAAIAAGLVVGSYFLTTYNKSEEPAVLGQAGQMATQVVPKPAASQAIPVAAPVPVTQPPASLLPKAHNSNTNLALHGLPAQKLQLPADKTTNTTEIIPDPGNGTKTLPEVAQVTLPKVRVLHLMDIHNENTRLMRADEPKPEMRWAWLLPDNNGQSGTESFSAQISQHILHPKNN
jgi:hypothetical protein